MSQEMQQPGDIADHIAMLVSAVESASHDLGGASARAAAKEAEVLLVEEIDREQTRAYAEGRSDEREDSDADALRFRWLCEHPDWHFIEHLCRQVVADSSMHFLTEMRRVIDARRSVELTAFEEHATAKSWPIDAPTLEDVMFAVFEYARISDGFDSAGGQERALQRDLMWARQIELRTMLGALQEQAFAEGRQVEQQELSGVLPGPYYMDPPDGGSVPVLEQLRRMARDARRWREQEESIRLAIECERGCEG